MDGKQSGGGGICDWYTNHKSRERAPFETKIVYLCGDIIAAGRWATISLICRITHVQHQSGARLMKRDGDYKIWIDVQQ